MVTNINFSYQHTAHSLTFFCGPLALTLSLLAEPAVLTPNATPTPLEAVAETT